MNPHVSEQGVCMYLIGDANLEEKQHVEECAACRAKIEGLVTSLSEFRTAVHHWSDRASAREHAAELRWTVIPPPDHLGRLLLPASLDVPWYRSLWNGIRDCFGPRVPPLDLTSKPVLVKEIWGQYGRQKKSWAMSFALQSAVVLLLFTVASSKTVQQGVVRMMPLLDPKLLSYAPEPPKATRHQGGGGGGDRSVLPPSKGQLPRAALKQFTPPVAMIRNSDPKLTMEPTIVAPPDVRLPQVNMSQYGDPLAALGIPSNGSGTGGGIGTGVGGGVGPGKGGGYGPGEAGGAGGGVFRVGGGISAPALLFRVEPEYSEEARKAKYQGTVILSVEVNPNGRVQNVRVIRSLGLGLDEKAIEAVKKWKFRPGYKDGKPVAVAATIEVNFRLL